MKTMDDISKLIELEEGFWRAAGSNGDYYKKHFLDEGIMVLPFKGGILNKKQTIAAVTQAEPWHSFEIKNPRAVPITEDSVILIYEAIGVRNNTPQYTALISSHYKHSDDNGWQLILHQQTPVS